MLYMLSIMIAHAIKVPGVRLGGEFGQRRIKPLSSRYIIGLPQATRRYNYLSRMSRQLKLFFSEV